MSLIKLQPQPKIPPIGFFQPITTDPKDMMTDVEFLLGVLKKLNEVIVQTNKNAEFIDNYDGKVDELEAEINAIRSEMTTFEGDVIDEINARFSVIKTELQSAIATTLVQANAYTDALGSRLEDEIEQISVGDITLYDPTTGTTNSLQTVITNLYNTSRVDALTAGEYDALELTASAYDAYQLTATNYDLYGKALLTNESA